MNEGMTSMIGKIIKFFPDTQTATIQLYMNKIVSTEQANYNTTTMAELIDVPCQFLKVQDFCITAPVKVGDTVIVDFMKYGITHWLYDDLEVYRVDEGRPEAAAIRRYSMQDAIAYIGLSNMVKPITTFNADDLEIRNTSGTQRIILKPDGEITITTNDKSTLTLLPDGTVNLDTAVELNVTTPVVNINSSTSVNIDSPIVNMTTNLRVEGNVNVGGDVSTDSKGSYNNHVHPKGDYKDAESRPLLSGNTGAI